MKQLLLLLLVVVLFLLILIEISLYEADNTHERHIFLRWVFVRGGEHIYIYIYIYRCVYGCFLFVVVHVKSLLVVVQ